MITTKSGVIDLRETMYPTIAYFFTENLSFWNHQYSTLYGYAFEDMIISVTRQRNSSSDRTRVFNIKRGEHFCIPISDEIIETTSTAGMFIFRYGFQGQQQVGYQPLDDTGRLSYIDGCSDSLLVYPPRKGDPSLNYLFFPIGTDQSFHTHPSIRIGCVVNGSGYSWLSEDKKETLEYKTMFALMEHEKHRFTTDSFGLMQIIAFHPDGDFGPTDENHSMINRTYVK